MLRRHIMKIHQRRMIHLERHLWWYQETITLLQIGLTVSVTLRSQRCLWLRVRKINCGMRSGATSSLKEVAVIYQTLLAGGRYVQLCTALSRVGGDSRNAE